jgi:hypothetical protein
LFELANRPRSTAALAEAMAPRGERRSTNEPRVVLCDLVVAIADGGDHLCV